MNDKVHDTENAQPAAGDEKQLLADAKGPRHADVQAQMRRSRSADKLRENLQRRKQQVRARRSGKADETDGLPAAKMDES